MDPLPKRTRTLYLLASIFLFIVTIPLTILYASGYRLSDLGGTFSLVPTGGVYVSVPQSDAVVSINGKEEGTSSLFTRNFYVGNLAPGSYAVNVTRDTSYPWYRRLIVEPGIVTDVQVFFAPQKIQPLRLVRGGAASSTASTTLGVTRTTYDGYLTLFRPATTTKDVIVSNGVRMATSSEGVFGPAPDDIQGGEELYIEDGAIRLHWTRSTSTIPSTFCAAPSSCVRDFLIKKGGEKIISARFWSGGVAYATAESGVYLVEADIRPTPVTAPLYPRAGSDFRLSGGDMIIKDGTSLYQISGF